MVPGDLEGLESFSLGGWVRHRLTNSVGELLLARYYGRVIAALQRPKEVVRERELIQPIELKVILEYDILDWMENYGYIFFFEVNSFSYPFLRY